MRLVTRHPYLFGLGVWAVFTIIFFVILTMLKLSFNMPVEAQLQHLINLLIALNAGTFILFGTDKILAMSQTRRVPEKILWLASFAGGPIGALLGMFVFRHKVSKTSFQLVPALVLLVEIAIIVTVLQKTNLL